MTASAWSATLLVMHHEHPSYRPAHHVPSEVVSAAILRSVALDGDEVCVEMTDAAVQILREEAEREDDDAYTFHGRDCDGRHWCVSLFDS